MITVTAHGGIDVEHERELLAEDREDLPRTARYWGREVKAHQVYATAHSRRHVMDRIALLEPSNPELRSLAHDVCYATAALFTYRRRPERNRWFLVGADRTLIDEPPSAAWTESEWQQAFWLAWAIRDAESLALLVQVRPELLDIRDAYEQPLVQALQAMFLRQRSTGEYLVRALELADPDTVTRTHPDGILDIVVPEIETLVPLAQRHGSELEQKLQQMLELRRDYNAKPNRDQDGGLMPFLAHEAVGIIAWAHDLGIAIDVKCPYVPAALLDVTDPQLRACVDCATPLTTGCQGCGRPLADPDDVLSLGFREWLDLELDPCATCAYPFPILVNTCPVCLSVRR